MFEIQDAAKAAFKASPGLYPIYSGIVRDEDEDMVDVNLTLLAIDLFRAREDKWYTSLKSYVEDVKEAFEQYIEQLSEEAVQLVIDCHGGSIDNAPLQYLFADYVSEWIKNGGEDDDIKDIAYNFVVYDNGKYLISNESKVV